MFRGRESGLLPKAGFHPGMAGPFVVMHFPEAAREVVWAETMTNPAVEAAATAFGSVCRAATS